MQIAMEIIDRSENPTDWQVHEMACCASVDHGTFNTYTWHEFSDGSCMLFRDTVKPVRAFRTLTEAHTWAEHGHTDH